MKYNKWMLGFFVFLGFLAYPSLKQGLSWEALYLLNFFLVPLFYSKKETKVIANYSIVAFNAFSKAFAFNKHSSYSFSGSHK